MEALNDDNIAGWSFLAMLVLLAIAVAVSGCSASQPEAEAAVASTRFTMDFVEDVDGAKNVTVSVLTDRETGRQWLFVRDTTFGNTSIDIEPMDWSEEDGAVSNQL